MSVQSFRYDFTAKELAYFLFKKKTCPKCGEQMKKFLPIGSVVLLKESQKRIMIVGVKQKQANSDKVWDYSACLYPEGILDPEKLFLFDTEQIERLYFIGLQDGEGLAFLNKINHLDDNADTTN